MTRIEQAQEMQAGHGNFQTLLKNRKILIMETEGNILHRNQ